MRVFWKDRRTEVTDLGRSMAFGPSNDWHWSSAAGGCAETHPTAQSLVLVSQVRLGVGPSRTADVPPTPSWRMRT